jgi:Alpha/beta hydrolase domain
MTIAYHPLRAGWQISTVAAALALSASAWAAAPRANVDAPPAGDAYGDRADQFGAYNYVEKEFVLSGMARTFKGTGTLKTDGKWTATVDTSSNPYKTAMIVRRPASAAQFNGIVLVEWLNVSSGYPLDVDWGMNHEEILRKGYAYVGIVNQKVGITGVQKLPQYGDRYAAHSISDDDLSYDILSQTGQAVKDQFATILGGLRPVKVLASGHSQSAMRLTTYANAIQPLDNVFDGIMIHGRANGGTSIGTNGSNVPLGYTSIRADSKVPVFQIQSQMDVSLNSGTSKATDSAKVRYWEVAGAAHADQYLLDNIYSVSEREVGFDQPACSKPHNAMPFYMAQNAVLRHLSNWAKNGTLPPTSPRMKRNWLGSLVKDANDNVVGGLRLPEIEAPIATYGNANFTTGSLAFLDLFACVAGGYTEYFDKAKLKTLYPTHADYVAKFKKAADAALAAGHILPEDHVKAMQRAQAAPIPE